MSEVPLKTAAESFLDRAITEAQILDPEGIHHEFASGRHGRKYDCDKIVTGSELYEEWVSLTARYILYRHANLPPAALVGVANGTNRLAADVAPEIGGGTICLETEKIHKLPVLTKRAASVIEHLRPYFALILEDVGTQGTNSLSVSNSLRQAGVSQIAVLNTIQRSPTLALLDTACVPYDSMVTRLEPSYTAEDCQSHGLCAKGWRLIEHK